MYPIHGSCSLRGPSGYCFQIVMAIEFGDLCYNGLHFYDHTALNVFVHEFAHALEGEIERLQPGFRDRLREIYESPDRKFASNWWENWAHAVDYWFYGGADRILEEAPLMAEQLDYWFPRVDLTSPLDLTLTYTDDCDECDNPELCRELKAEYEGNR